MGEGKIVKPILVFFVYDTLIFYNINEPKPEPVPPPTELNIINPCNPSHFSTSFLSLSIQGSAN
jgi:hypothetical protein